MDGENWRVLDARLRVVEARLGFGTESEAAPGGVDRTQVSPPDLDPATFWVLTGLRDRLADVEGGGITYAGTVTTPAGSAEWQYGLPTETLLAVDDGTVETAAGRLAALGHPIRLRLLLAVLDGHASASELAGLEGMGTSGQVYHHLRTLTAAGWLRSAGRSRVEVPAERLVPLLVALSTAI